MSDEETVLQIQENPYLQYFVRLSSYKEEAPFTPSLFVIIRKRMGSADFSSFEQTILDSIEEKKVKQGSGQVKKEKAENHGKMLVDATVAEQAIHYLTDLSLLNEAREISETLIDELYKLSSLTKKPRGHTGNRRERATLLLLKSERLAANFAERESSSNCSTYEGAFIKEILKNNNLRQVA